MLLCKIHLKMFSIKMLHNLFIILLTRDIYSGAQKKVPMKKRVSTINYNFFNKKIKIIC